MKIWLSILMYFRSLNRTGPTIPFLIGSEEYLTGEKPNISDLLSEFSESSMPIFIANCTTIDSLVVTLDERMINIFSKISKFGNLTVQARDLDWINSIEDLNNHLEALYMKILNDRSYSRINREWKKLDDDDTQLIQKARKK